MSAVGMHKASWSVYAVPGLIGLAAIGMLVTATLHAQLGKSVLLDSVAVASFAASFIGAVGALILANTRRNVMWILPVAIAMTVLLALLAIILSALAE
jgi:hypothetical protein